MTVTRISYSSDYHEIQTFPHLMQINNASRDYTTS